MIIKKELIKREIAGDTILVPVGSTVLDSNGLFMLNELGTFIWNILPQVECEEEICALICSEYEILPEDAAKDVTEFLTRLKELNII